MLPMLRLFRHHDGTLAHFNGMGPTPADHLATILIYDDVRAQPMRHAPHSGYERLQAGTALMIADVGSAPPDTTFVRLRNFHSRTVPLFRAYPLPQHAKR